jgi:hypothetical protein
MRMLISPRLPGSLTPSFYQHHAPLFKLASDAGPQLQDHAVELFSRNDTRRACYLVPPQTHSFRLDHYLISGAHSR